jgi:hypothetical protein
MLCIYFCPECDEFCSFETEDPRGSSPLHSTCNERTYYTGYTEDMFETISKEQQEIIKDKVIKKIMQKNQIDSANDIRTIKNILVFYVVMSIIGAIVTLFHWFM